MSAPRISIKNLDRLHAAALDWQGFALAAHPAWPAISRALKAAKLLIDSDRGTGDDGQTHWDELAAAMEVIEP